MQTRFPIMSCFEELPPVTPQPGLRRSRIARGKTALLNPERQRGASNGLGIDSALYDYSYPQNRQQWER